MGLWLLQRAGQALRAVVAMSLVVFLGLHAAGNPADPLLAPDATQLDRAEQIATSHPIGRAAI